MIDNTISDNQTVIEVQTQDRFGLLYKLTRLLFEQGLDIALAKISTEANRAIDVFYVTDTQGEKIVDRGVIGQIQQTLLEALQ
jgi:[protein-PII] uridylyltransferase